MFHDLQRVPFVCGWALIWSGLSSFYCGIDVPNPFSYTLKPLLKCVCARVHTSGVFVLRLCLWMKVGFFVCIFVFPLLFPDPRSLSKIKYCWEARNDLAPAHRPLRLWFRKFFERCRNHRTMEFRGRLWKTLQEYNSCPTAHWFDNFSSFLRKTSIWVWSVFCGALVFFILYF